MAEESTNVLIRIIAEVTKGVTPVDGAWEELRFISDTLTSDAQTKVSGEARQDRNVSDQFITGITTGGGITCEVHRATYDALVAALMCTDWATDVCKIGVLDKYFSIEKEYAGLAGFMGVNFTGEKVSSGSFGFRFGNEVTADFTFAGMGSNVNESASLVGSGSSTAVNANPVINAGGQLSALELDGSSTAIIFREISLKVDNSVEAINGVGSNTALGQSKGRAMVSGSVTCHLDANSWPFLAASLAQTSQSLKWQVSDGTGGYEFFVPNMQLSGAIPPRPGPDQSVMFSGNFVGLYDVSEATSLRVTRGVT
jgi:hypothetical protein